MKFRSKTQPDKEMNMQIVNRRTALLGTITVVGLLAITIPSQGGGCCGSGTAGGHGDHGAAASSDNSKAPSKAPMEPVPSVLANYAKIETALASDKLDGVPEAAQAIAKLVTGDDMKMLPVDVATHANALAKANNIEAARAAFKPLSASLISYLAKEKVQTGRYYEAYCAMANASWLQTDKAIKNPYYGASMLKCGEIKNVY